jgi:Na+/H+-translocating membrane pyrophosphatase
MLRVTCALWVRQHKGLHAQYEVQRMLRAGASALLLIYHIIAIIIIIIAIIIIIIIIYYYFEMTDFSCLI